MDESYYNQHKHREHQLYLEDLKKEFMRRFKNPQKCTGTLDDYDIIEAIGKGTFGQVLLVRNKRLINKYQCMKVINKNKVVERNLVKNLLLEKKLMQCANFPFILLLEDAFKDNLYLYMITPFIPGGELFTYIKNNGALCEQLSKFYASQVILAVEYLHYLSIIHRDIKPENILIDANGYIMLADFGFSKILNKRTWTLCGTPQYFAPEIILSQGYSFSVDWWTIGVLIYEMCAGYPPFSSADPTALYDKILEGAYKCPTNMSSDCKSLLKGLLQVEPSRRYGNLKSSTHDIKSHSWFSELNWESILHQNSTPPYIPKPTRDGDTSNFPKIDAAKLQKSSISMYEAEFAEF